MKLMTVMGKNDFYGIALPIMKLRNVSKWTNKNHSYPKKQRKNIPNSKL